MFWKTVYKQIDVKFWVVYCCSCSCEILSRRDIVGISFFFLWFVAMLCAVLCLAFCPVDIFYAISKTKVTSDAVLPAFAVWEWPFLLSIPSKSGKVNICMCAAHIFLKLWHEQSFSLLSVWIAAVNWAGKAHQPPSGQHIHEFRTISSL